MPSSGSGHNLSTSSSFQDPLSLNEDIHAVESPGQEVGSGEDVKKASEATGNIVGETGAEEENDHGNFAIEEEMGNEDIAEGALSPGMEKDGSGQWVDLSV